VRYSQVLGIKTLNSLGFDGVIIQLTTVGHLKHNLLSVILKQMTFQEDEEKLEGPKTEVTL
jgi:hypothetical protein